MHQVPKEISHEKPFPKGKLEVKKKEVNQKNKKIEKFSSRSLRNSKRKTKVKPIKGFSRITDAEYLIKVFGWEILKRFAKS